MKRTTKLTSMLIALLSMPLIMMALPYENDWNRKGARFEIDRSYYRDFRNGIPTSIYRYEYDAAGNVVREIRNILQFGHWVDEGDDRVWTYDSRNNCTSDTQLSINSMGQEYAVWKHEYAYDSRNNMIEDVYYGDKNSQLVPERKETYAYDANNNLITYVRYSYYGGDARWEDIEKMEYTYDAHGNLLTSTRYFGGEGAWQKTYYYIYTYDSNDLLTNRNMFDVDYKGVVTETERVKYSYDAKGNETERLEAVWSKSEEKWIFSQKYTHAYNDKGQMLYERYYIDETTISGGQKYDYDEQGNVTAITYCSFNQDGTVKDIEGVRTYYYTDDALYQGELAQGVCGPEGNEDAITWKIDKDNTLTISGTGSMVDYDYYYSTMPWLVGQMFIKKIVVGEGITHISGYAFKGADKVEELVLPSTLQTIGENAFYQLYSLKALTLPDALTSVGSHAFDECKSLQSVTFGSKLEEIGYSAFEDCDIQTLKFPESLRKILDNAFSYNNNLTYFNIPAGVTFVGAGAFDGENVHQVDCYAENNPFESGSVYCPNAILYVPVGCKSNYMKNSLKNSFLDILEFGETYTPKQYVINGVAYAYTDDALDVYGDGSVIVEGARVKLYGAHLKDGLAINISNATIEVSGKCSVQGGIHVKDKLMVTSSNDYDGVSTLSVSGAVYCDDTSTTEPLKLNIAYFSATLPEKAAAAPMTRADDNQQSVVSGFAYIEYNSFYHQMREPENGYYDGFSRMLLDANSQPATKVVIANQYGINGVDQVVTEKAKEGKYLNNGQIIITRNGRNYNLNGMEIK